VDSIGKKITVVKEISAALGLKNAKADQIRAEELKEKYDFVVSRAVTELSSFVKWVQNKFAKQTIANDLPNGILYLKGGDLTEELKPFRNKVKIYELKGCFGDCLPPEEKEFFETKKVVYLPA
jgi:16S rRNA (guanine527-N7)-methyltransferase